MGGYQTQDGKPISLDKLCKTEPAWAASRIRADKQRIAELDGKAAFLRDTIALKDARIAELEAEMRLSEIEARGCARDQHTTQYCAEVIERDKRIEALEECMSAWRRMHW